MKEAEDSKAKEEEALAIIKAKEDKKLAGKLYRDTTKAIVELCKSNMPGSKFDRFYLDEKFKKYQSQEDVGTLLADLTKVFELNHLDHLDTEMEFLGIIDKTLVASKAEEKLKK